MYPLDGPPERRELRTVAELRAALQERFRLDLSDLPELDGALRRLF